jgi:hypothetical protein
MTKTEDDARKLFKLVALRVAGIAVVVGDDLKVVFSGRQAGSGVTGLAGYQQAKQQIANKFPHRMKVTQGLDYFPVDSW